MNKATVERELIESMMIPQIHTDSLRHQRSDTSRTEFTALNFDERLRKEWSLYMDSVDEKLSRCETYRQFFR